MNSKRTLRQPERRSTGKSRKTRDYDEQLDLFDENGFEALDGFDDFESGEPDDQRPRRRSAASKPKSSRRARSDAYEDDGAYEPRRRRSSSARYSAYDEEMPGRGSRRSRSYDDGRPARRGAPGRKKPSKSARRRKKKSGMNALLSWVIAVIVALVIGFFIKTFWFELAVVSSDAMSGTLEAGQIVVIQKGVYYQSAPARGDIVGVRADNGLALRRVVALPGESIEIQSGVTIVNGEPLEEPYVATRDTGGYQQVTLASGRYFVMCDNRLNMDDSRSYGPDQISRNRISGKVGFILWPLDQWGAVS